MKKPRSKQIDSNKPGYYIITARSVHRSWLCGVDKYTGVNYDYRNPWVRDKIKELNEGFFIEVGSYAVMNNHMHMILKNFPDLNPVNKTDKRGKTEMQKLCIFCKICRIFHNFFILSILFILSKLKLIRNVLTGYTGLSGCRLIFKFTFFRVLII